MMIRIMKRVQSFLQVIESFVRLQNPMFPFCMNPKLYRVPVYCRYPHRIGELGLEISLALDVFVVMIHAVPKIAHGFTISVYPSASAVRQCNHFR